MFPICTQARFWTNVPWPAPPALPYTYKIPDVTGNAGKKVIWWFRVIDKVWTCTYMAISCWENPSIIILLLLNAAPVELVLHVSLLSFSFALHFVLLSLALVFTNFCGWQLNDRYCASLGSDTHHLFLAILQRNNLKLRTQDFSVLKMQSLFLDCVPSLHSYISLLFPF